MAKLTLSVEESVVSGAKQYAKLRGVSVSEMVETYLVSVTAVGAGERPAPVLRSVRGILKNADAGASDVGAYREHLAEKYR